MTQKLGSSSSKGGRITGDLGTVLTSSNIAVGAGWGTSPDLTIASGSNDVRGILTITAKATPSQSTATVIITYADGAYPSAPHPIVNMHSDQAIGDSGSVRAVSTTTALTITSDVLPVAGKIYVIKYGVFA